MEIWTPKSLLDWCAGYFADKGVPQPRFDAELLLAHVLECSRLDLYLKFDRPTHPEELERFRALVRRRAGREPVAYITGACGFWGLELSVGPGCLVPRPDTESLVEATVESLAELRGEGIAPENHPLVAEWGAGSGAIGLAVLSETEGVHWFATEQSGEALRVAQRNARGHADLIQSRQHRWSLVRGSGLAPLAPTARPALIVSNPPYIPSAEIDDLEPEVAQYEPRMALDGGEDGLDAYRELVAEAGTRLRPGGRLLLEIGHDQGQAVAQLVSEHTHLAVAAIRPDLAGRDRVAIISRAA